MLSISVKGTLVTTYFSETSGTVSLASIADLPKASISTCSFQVPIWGACTFLTETDGALSDASRQSHSKLLISADAISATRTKADDQGPIVCPVSHG